jgi:hypothetical protein
LPEQTKLAWNLMSCAFTGTVCRVVAPANLPRDQAGPDGR